MTVEDINKDLYNKNDSNSSKYLYYMQKLSWMLNEDKKMIKDLEGNRFKKHISLYY